MSTDTVFSMGCHLITMWQSHFFVFFDAKIATTQRHVPAFCCSPVHFIYASGLLCCPMCQGIVIPGSLSLVSLQSRGHSWCGIFPGLIWNGCGIFPMLNPPPPPLRKNPCTDFSPSLHDYTEALGIIPGSKCRALFRHAKANKGKP